jgi:hypothetical protein
LEFGIWNLEFGIWNLEFGIWNLEFGIWNLEFGIWNAELRALFRLGTDISVAKKEIWKKLEFGMCNISNYLGFHF